MRNLLRFSLLRSPVGDRFLLRTSDGVQVWEKVTIHEYFARTIM